MIPSQKRQDPLSETTGQRREVDLFAPVEAEAERAQPVGVTERFEPAGELDRYQLRAAALLPVTRWRIGTAASWPCSDRA